MAGEIYIMRTVYINEHGENWLFFVAEDGEEFETPDECAAYEYALLVENIN